jgi:hypothetical protein
METIHPFRFDTNEPSMTQSFALDGVIDAIKGSLDAHANKADFWQIRGHFSDLLQGDLLTTWIERALADACGLRPNVPPGDATQVVVCDHPSFRIALQRAVGTRRYLRTGARRGFLSIAHGGNVECTRYRLPPDFNAAVFDPTTALVEDRALEVREREVFDLQTDRYVYDFHFTGPVVLLTLLSRPLDSAEWLFRRDNLTAWEALDSSTDSTRLRNAAFVLGRMAYDSSLPALNKLTAHPHHQVRWAAVQAIGRISRTATIELLRKIELADPHPHLRDAASRTLRQFTAEADKAAAPGP